MAGPGIIDYLTYLTIKSLVTNSSPQEAGPSYHISLAHSHSYLPIVEDLSPPAKGGCDLFREVIASNNLYQLARELWRRYLL